MIDHRHFCIDVSFYCRTRTGRMNSKDTKYLVDESEATICLCEAEPQVVVLGRYEAWIDAEAPDRPDDLGSANDCRSRKTIATEKQFPIICMALRSVVDYATGRVTPPLLGVTDDIETRFEFRHATRQLGRLPPIVRIEESEERTVGELYGEVTRRRNDAVIREIQDFDSRVAERFHNRARVIRRMIVYDNRSPVGEILSDDGSQRFGKEVGLVEGWYNHRDVGWRPRRGFRWGHL